MTRTTPDLRAFSDELMEAATRVDELDGSELSRLLMKAAIRLRVIKQAGPNLEHIPVYAYHLLRRVSEGPVTVASLHARDDRTAADFLVSRQRAELSADGLRVSITAAGNELGEIAAEERQER